MLYSVFISKAIDLVIIEDEETNIWYLDPMWEDTLHRNGLGDLEDLEDSYITDWLAVEDILKLEVKRRNIMRMNKVKTVIDWLYDLITATVEPAMLAEETDYVKAVTEFMKENHKQEKVE